MASASAGEISFFSVLLSGAGTWPQLAAASVRGIRAVFMRVQRMLLGNFRGTAAATCDSEVLRELGASSLAIELRKARLIWCAWNSQVIARGSWVTASRADLDDVKARSGGEIVRWNTVFTRPAAVVQSFEVLSRSVEGARGRGVQRRRSEWHG